MSDTELRKRIEELDAEFAEPEPVVESQVDLLARLIELDPPEVEEEEEETKEQEIFLDPPAPVLSSGTLELRFKHAVVRRDVEGRIVELIEEKTRTYLHRDVAGQIVEITKVEEVEEVTDDEEEEGTEEGETAGAEENQEDESETADE